MTVSFQPVESAQDVEQLAKLADEIWHEYWPALIGKAQTDYMVEQFQSLSAIKRDMAEHAYEYWFIVAQEDGEKNSAGADGCAGESANASEGGTGAEPARTRIVGYTGGHVEPETNRFFVSKIYLRAEERGKGFASQTIRFYEDLCRTRNLHAAYLTVNKHNDLGIRAYRAKGFETIDAVETDIGNGFIMDDYIMELQVPSA